MCTHIYDCIFYIYNALPRACHQHHHQHHQTCTPTRTTKTATAELNLDNQNDVGRAEEMIGERPMAEKLNVQYAEKGKRATKSLLLPYFL
jgi:hypothetical protein